MDNSEYISIENFAAQHGVPVQAVQNAIDLNKIKTGWVKDTQLIAVNESYRFELIGVYEYADRKKVTFAAVYKRTLAHAKKKILYSLEPGTNCMKIDWQLYKDEKFQSFTFRHRNKSVKS